MKKLIILLLLACCIAAEVEAKRVRVGTRGGKAYVGELKEMKSFEHVILVVDGKEVVIPFDEMIYIDELKEGGPLEKTVVVVEPVPVVKKVEPESKPKPDVPKVEPVPEPVQEPVVKKEEPKPEPVEAKVEAVPEPEPVVTKVEPEPATALVPELNVYKGFLLDDGNKVYLNCKCDPTLAEYDQAALDVLKRQLRRDGYWVAVDNPNEAHFFINYTASSEGGGKITLSISSQLTGKEEILGSAKVPEDVDENRKLVWELYNKYVIPLHKKIEKGNVPKRTKSYFTVE